MNEQEIMSAVSRAMYEEKVPTFTRIFSLHRNDRGTLSGLLTPYTSMELLLLYRDAILRAARMADNGIVGI